MNRSNNPAKLIKDYRIVKFKLVINKIVYVETSGLHI